MWNYCIQIQYYNYKRGYMKQRMANIPAVLFETAFCRSMVPNLIQLALQQGLRGINTGNDIKSYERYVLAQGIQKSAIPRNQLFIQSKYKYFETEHWSTSVRKSASYTLAKLKTNYIDSFVLQCPQQYQTQSFKEDSRQIWNCFEKLVQEGKVHYLGVSGCYNRLFFENFYNQVTIKPTFLLNQLHKFPRFQYSDREIFKFCNDQGIKYQIYWPSKLSDITLQKMEDLQKKYNRTSDQLIFRALTQMNIILLVERKFIEKKPFDLSILDLDIEKNDLREIWQKLNQ